VVDKITKQIEEYRIDLAADTIYHYVWHTFADVILEESKKALNGEDEKVKLSAQWTLYVILTTSLKTLHPFMPFITETVWSKLPEKDSELLMIADWPTIE
jgi:valyl-tRNA synthetase